MKYNVIIHHFGGGFSIMQHRNKEEFCKRTAKKHLSDLVKRNTENGQFKALHLCCAGDVWNCQRLIK